MSVQELEIVEIIATELDSFESIVEAIEDYADSLPSFA